MVDRVCAASIGSTITEHRRSRQHDELLLFYYFMYRYVTMLH